jgi:hypothetical protein
MSPTGLPTVMNASKNGDHTANFQARFAPENQSLAKQ